MSLLNGSLDERDEEIRLKTEWNKLTDGQDDRCTDRQRKVVFDFWRRKKYENKSLEIIHTKSLGMNASFLKAKPQRIKYFFLFFLIGIKFFYQNQIFPWRKKKISLMQI